MAEVGDGILDGFPINFALELFFILEVEQNFLQAVSSLDFGVIDGRRAQQADT